MTRGDGREVFIPGGPAHRGGRLGEVESVTSTQFRQMEKDRRTVERIEGVTAALELLAEDEYATPGERVIAKMLRAALDGPQ